MTWRRRTSTPSWASATGQSFAQVRGYNYPAFDEAAAKQLVAKSDAERKVAVQEMQRLGPAVPCLLVPSPHGGGAGAV